MIFKTSFDQDIFQHYSDLTSPFKFIKHPLLYTGIDMNPFQVWREFWFSPVSATFFYHMHTASW